MSWTGTEHQRREQLGCKPPAIPRNETGRLVIPSGVSCSVRKVTEVDWQPFTTTKESSFDRYEFIDRGCFVFRHDGWQLRVLMHKVTRNCR